MESGVFIGISGDTYTVGDGLGWTLPPAGNIAYSTWANSKRFEVGDVIVFQWSGNGTHTVVEVSKADYDNCTTTNPIGTIFQTSPASINLTTNATRYFICTISNHCRNFGQKVTFGIQDRRWDDDWNSASSLSFGAFATLFSIFITFFLSYY
ncbi:hypothetical protein UlMin_045956 [Ulmus minor]